jgi:hypothetical protein
MATPARRSSSTNPCSAGELALNMFGEYGAPGTPEADNIMHGMLESPSGYAIMGADTPPGVEFGLCTDQFGVDSMVNIAGAPA